LTKIIIYIIVIIGDKMDYTLAIFVGDLTNRNFCIAILAILMSALMITGGIVYAIRKNAKHVLDRNFYIAGLFEDAARHYTILALAIFLSVGLKSMSSSPVNEPNYAILLGWVCAGFVLIFGVVALVYNYRPRAA